jgi:TonB family protein
VHSSTSKLALALFLSIAVHSVLFLSDATPEPYLSQHSIIHARLDKQDRELVQQEQVGQITEQHNEKISQASAPSSAAEDQPLKQDATKASTKTQDQEVINSRGKSQNKTVAEPVEETPEVDTAETEIKELVEKTEVAATQPKIQQDSQVSSDSRAQVKALEGSEDPTYTSYRRVLTQYLGQRLEAKAEYRGEVRLKIKLEYGSIATSIKIIKSSGNLELDSWARKAALAASPYPKIPKEIGSTFEFSPTLQLGKPEL